MDTIYIKKEVSKSKEELHVYVVGKKELTGRQVLNITDSAQQTPYFS